MLGDKERDPRSFIYEIQKRFLIEYKKLIQGFSQEKNRMKDYVFCIQYVNIVVLESESGKIMALTQCLIV